MSSYIKDAEDDSISYQNPVKIATSLEPAERDAAAVEGRSTTGMGDDMGLSVHAVHLLEQRGGGGAAARTVATVAAQPITTMSCVVSVTTSAVGADAWGACAARARNMCALRDPRRCTMETRRTSTRKFSGKRTFIIYV